MPVTSAAVVGIDPSRAAVLARVAGRAGDDLQALLNRVRGDLDGQCTGVPSLLGSAAQWLREASADVVRRASVAQDDRVFGFIGPLPAPLPYGDALIGFLSAGNPLAVRLMVAGLSKAQLVGLAQAVLRELAGASLSDDERLMYRRALLPLAARLLVLAGGPATVAYVGGAGAGAAAREVRDLMSLVEGLMLAPPHRQGSGWEAFFRGMFLGDWDRGYTTPGLESARVTGQLLGGLIPGVDLRDVAASLHNRDWLGVVLGAVALVPLYGDLLRIGSKAIGTGLRLSRAADDVRSLAKAADRLAVPMAPVSTAATRTVQVRTVASGAARVTAGPASMPSSAMGSGVVDLGALAPSVRAGLQQVALGRVSGFAVGAGDIGALPPKPDGHFTRYELADGTSVVTGKDAELYVSADGGCTWSVVR